MTELLDNLVANGTLPRTASSAPEFVQKYTGKVLMHAGTGLVLRGALPEPGQPQRPRRQIGAGAPLPGRVRRRWPATSAAAPGSHRSHSTNLEAVKKFLEFVTSRRLPGGTRTGG